MPSINWSRAFGIARAVARELVQAKGELDGPDVHAWAAHGMSGAAGALPFLEQIQRAFGHHDLGGVRAHVGGPAAEAAPAADDTFDVKSATGKELDARFGDLDDYPTSGRVNERRSFVRRYLASV